MNWRRELLNQGHEWLGRVGVRVSPVRPTQLAEGGVHRVQTPHGELSLLVLDRGDSVQGEHAQGRIYEPEELALIERHFQGGTVVDVGANVGNHSLWLATLERTQRVIAFEPNPQAFAILQYNVAINGLQHKVETHHLALSNRNGEARLRQPHSNLGGSSLEQQMPSRAGVVAEHTCRCVVGSEWLKEPVQLIKVDVEGHELACMQGLLPLLSRAKPLLFIEVADKNKKDLLAFFKRIDYTVVEEYSRYQGMVNWLLHSCPND
jgi:FkbM family methyltransferase